MALEPKLPSLFRPSQRIDQTVLREHRDLVGKIERRQFLRGAVTLGSLTMLSGCDITDRTSVQAVLSAISNWNDRVQSFIFNPKRLAPEYSASQVLRPPRFNAYIGRDQVPEVDAASWKLELAGLIGDKRPWTLNQIKALPHVTQRTRHVCVEGWDYIGEWTGVPMALFLEKIGADTSAKYVGFKCADKYTGSIDMATALHPQTQLTTMYAGEPLNRFTGAPIRLRAATKLGFKTPKQILSIEVTNTNPLGYWETRGFNWFSGI